MQEVDPVFYEIAKFYEMDPGVDLMEITSKLLQSPLVEEREKQSMRNGRKVFLFTYPSDQLSIKGIISFTSHVEKNPLLLYLRGGNRLFGLPSPGMCWICCDPYTTISTTYRGGVSEGHDEFGGNDVNDVKNLIDFLPILQKKLDLALPSHPMTLLGASRGGMQMFLALARFPELQQRFNKIISLSGLLDLRQMILTRPDMKKMFIDDFGLKQGIHDEAWINQRDPLLAASKIDKQLPVYIIQGTDDQQINLKQGYNMVNTLQFGGGKVHYKEFSGATHCLKNIQNRATIVLNC